MSGILNYLRTQPARVVAATIAIIGVASSFGLGITEGQTAAIVSVVGAVLALIGGEVVRAQVTPVVKLGMAQDSNSGLAEQIAVISEQLALLDAKFPDPSLADPVPVSDPVPASDPVSDPVPASDPAAPDPVPDPAPVLDPVPEPTPPAPPVADPTPAPAVPASDIPTAIADLTRQYVADGTAILEQVMSR